MWYAETRLVRIDFHPPRFEPSQNSFIQGPERIKGAYAYQSLLRYAQHSSPKHKNKIPG